LLTHWLASECKLAMTTTTSFMARIGRRRNMGRRRWTSLSQQRPS